MEVIIQRIPTGIPLKYFDVDAKDCENFWRNRQTIKHLFIREINRTIIKPHNQLAFTFIGYDITYSVNQKTKLVEKLTILESVIVYLPKWKQFRSKPSRMQNRYLSFLKKALYHENKYHGYLYEEKQLDFLYKVLKNIKQPTITKVSSNIKKFQSRLIKEQELSHLKAPKGKPFCFTHPLLNEKISKVKNL
jgi:hypothetical protein